MLFTQVITNISYVLGPVAQFHENSRFYSAVAPKPNPEVDNRLPHITIQMPVYKESLKETMCVFYLLFFLVLFLLSTWVWARTCITGFHVDDRWDLRARRDLRGIAVSPLGLGGEIAIAALLGSWNEAGAYRDEMFRCGLVSFLVASGVGWNADARWRLDGDA